MTPAAPAAAFAGDASGAFKLDVLRVEGGLIAEITTFDKSCSRPSGCRRRCDAGSAHCTRLWRRP
ncbi:MAG TPA: hypothetical protein VHZ31_00325 [Solirubrobacteraceae bacterium]|nr:hypothetical protein [Solirubrobacteraceae bacterium]